MRIYLPPPPIYTYIAHCEHANCVRRQRMCLDSRERPRNLYGLCAIYHIYWPINENGCQSGGEIFRNNVSFNLCANSMPCHKGHPPTGNHKHILTHTVRCLFVSCLSGGQNTKYKKWNREKKNEWPLCKNGSLSASHRSFKWHSISLQQALLMISTTKQFLIHHKMCVPCTYFHVFFFSFFYIFRRLYI